MQKTLLFALLLLFFNACGGGASQHEPREEKTLYFVDSPTNGIDYHCGERKGVTKSYTQNGITKHGLFKCVYAPIHFSLGNLSLGSIDNIMNGQTIRPQDLVNSFNGDFNNEEVLKIAILLQSLDDKNNTNYLNISQSTKDKITLTTLDNLSIEQLSIALTEMGFTPIAKEDAKVHLILNSPNVHSGKPTIETFEEEISNELTVGNTIGELSIKKGDGELLYPFVLEGEGKEHFLLNNNGKLIVTQSFSTAQTFELNVTVSNQYGYTTAPLTIHVKNSGKIGKAQLGRLKNATVKLFKVTSSATLELVTTQITKSIGSLNLLGNFDLHTEELEDHSFYVYEVSEGVDVDADDNAQEDDAPSSNHGKIRLISKGIWIKNATNKIRITPLSEMLYTYLERDGLTNIESKLDKYSKILLKNSLDTETKINAKDIMIFNPLKDKEALYPTLTYNSTYNNIREQIRHGNSTYKNTIFNAYIIESFQANAIEIVGSSIYTIDMIGSGEFNIYDLETKEKIGGVKLPYAPVEEDTHVLYINLLHSEARVSSLTDWSHELYITDQTKPILAVEPFIKDVLITGNFTRTALGKSSISNFFSQEQQTHLYNLPKDSNKTETIKFFNIDINNDFYQFKFNSELKKIDSLWVKNDYLYVVGENKMHIFKETNTEANLSTVYNETVVSGDILGIEENILYLQKERNLTLYDISSPSNPKFIETITVPFDYKLGIKTNGNYITTGSQILDINALRASN
ncbi:MAG: Unknown protein [uncultured Sulfurovum sp.]|uniref:Cadherin domain-containing protein n=1 Tax=uncultured Sulfurovum sp. TaxID=269237 RepID=A0A6S6SPP6_9BACT|nr:MAG: Unknown protein [uncultured Sulfurovum sp.]